MDIDDRDAAVEQLADRCNVRLGVCADRPPLDDLIKWHFRLSLLLNRPGIDDVVIALEGLGSEPPQLGGVLGLWIIGLGNLGQAFAWLLGCLPYPASPPPLLVLQDFDRVTPANESTSLLTSPRDVRCKKTRLVADWLDRRGFETVIEEREDRL